MIAVPLSLWVKVHMLIATLCAFSCVFCIIESSFLTFAESDLYRFSLAREAVDAIGLFLARVPTVLLAYAIAKLCLPERIEDATSILAILAGLASLCVILFCLRRFTGLSVLELNELSTGLLIIEVNAIAWATCVSYPSAIASGLSDAVKICVEKWRGLFIPLSILGMILTTGLLYRIEFLF